MGGIDWLLISATPRFGGDERQGLAGADLHAGRAFWAGKAQVAFQVDSLAANGFVPNCGRRHLAVLWRQGTGFEAGAASPAHGGVNETGAGAWIDAYGRLAPLGSAGIEAGWPVALLADDDRGGTGPKVVVLDVDARQARVALSIVAQGASHLALAAGHAQAGIGPDDP